MAETIRLISSSRFRNTRVLRDATGTIFFGAWRPPPIVETVDPTIYTVRADETNRPDLVSSRVYGNPNLFWAIAIRNNFLFPLGETVAGKNLVIPNIEDVLEAISSSSADGPERR